VGCGIGKKGKKGMALIWHSLIWTVWRMRNNRIFNKGVIDVEEAVESIKRMAWQWFIGRMAISSCLCIVAFCYMSCPLLFWFLFVCCCIFFRFCCTLGGFRLIGVSTPYLVPSVSMFVHQLSSTSCAWGL
jgi:hypothetical protein